MTACDGPGAEFEREEVWVTPDSSRMPHCKVCKTQGCMHFRRGFAHLLALNQVRTRPRVLCGCGLRAPQCSKARCVATGLVFVASAHCGRCCMSPVTTHSKRVSMLAWTTALPRCARKQNLLVGIGSCCSDHASPSRRPVALPQDCGIPTLATEKGAGEEVRCLSARARNLVWCAWMLRSWSISTGSLPGPDQQRLWRYRLCDVLSIFVFLSLAAGERRHSGPNLVPMPRLQRARRSRW
jgi:hypothetical protein